MAGAEAERTSKARCRRPHASSWYALASIILGIITVNVAGFPFVAIQSVAERFYPGIPAGVVQWLPFTAAIVSIPVIFLALPAIRRFGIHVVVYTSAGLLLLGSVIRCYAVAVPVHDDGTEPDASYVLVHLGTAAFAMAFAPFQIAGTLVSTTFPRNGSVAVQAMVAAATPLGLVVGAALPQALQLIPAQPASVTPRHMYRLILVLTIVPAVAAVAIVVLMSRAMAEFKKAAAPAAAPLADESSGQPCVHVTAGAEPARADLDMDDLPEVHVTDALPQLARLASSGEFVSIAAAFALVVAPLQLVYNRQELLLESESFVKDFSEQITVGILLASTLLLPLVLHAFYTSRAVRHVHTIVGTLLLLALSAVSANLSAAHGHFGGADFSYNAYFLSALALLATALMAVLLAQAVAATRRHRPAVAAGAMWLAAHSLTILFGAIAEALQCGGDDDACTFDRIKWLLVASFAAASVATVVSLLLCPREDAVQPREEEETQSVRSLYMTSNYRDALHPDNLPASFVRPVWWQNQAAVALDNGGGATIEDFELKIETPPRGKAGYGLAALPAVGQGRGVPGLTPPRLSREERL